MLENQFIQFTNGTGFCGIPVLTKGSLSFIVDIDDSTDMFDIITSDGTVIDIPSANVIMTPYAQKYKWVFIRDLQTLINPGTCFRIRRYGAQIYNDVLSCEKIDMAVCKNNDDPIYEAATFSPGIYRLKINNNMYLRGKWHLSEETTNIDGHFSVYADGDPVRVYFKNGRVNQTGIFNIESESGIEIDLCVNKIDDEDPDCDHSYVYAEIDEYPPTLKGYDAETTVVSNLLKLVENQDGVTDVWYECNEDAFGFPFSTVPISLSCVLPIRLHSPQNVQDDKTYVKANGEVVTLYAKYYKEWEGVTDFLPEAMHDKIVAALSCDEVYINGTRVTKTDSYKLDWDNYDLDCDGTTKLVKATFKVREHITQRNSNY